MRALPSSLSAKLASGATTLARCWILRRRDGRTLGFTDHDRDLAVDGVPCLAATGLEAADVTAESGLVPGGGDVAGVLRSDSLAEEDVRGGLYDGAELSLWLVDWSDPADRVLLQRGTIGEIRRGAGSFVAELRTAAARLDEVRGRLFRPACDADLGDSRCGVDLSVAGRRVKARIGSTDGTATLSAPEIAPYPAGWFAGGRLTIASGPSTGVRSEVKDHVGTGAEASLVLWQPAAAGLAAGDLFVVETGCDRRFETCRDKFSNVANFRGFPHIPGNAIILSAARPGSGTLQGGSPWR
jgi:uncharacterized phage protein (TIGR02218 family)